MMWLKSCPRCEKGDLYLDEENDKRCMQCGYLEYGSSGASSLIDSKKVRDLLKQFQAQGKGAVAA